MGNYYSNQSNLQKINYEGEYWEYCWIKIPMSINQVPSINRYGVEFKPPGGQLVDFINRQNLKPYTVEEYQKKYAIVGKDGKLYWKE